MRQNRHRQRSSCEGRRSPIHSDSEFSVVGEAAAIEAGLIDDLRLRLDREAAAEPDRIAALKRGGKAGAVGGEHPKPAMGVARRVIPGALQDTVEVPARRPEMGPVGAGAGGGELVGTGA